MSDEPTWEHLVKKVGVERLETLHDDLNRLGAEGWELVAVVVPSFKPGMFGALGDALVTCKRRCVPLPAPETLEAGWHDDPTGRFDKRYWDGQRWSAHVGRTGPPKVTAIDPPTILAPSEL